MLITKENFITLNQGKFLDFYSPGEVLGTGAYGEVRECFHHTSKESRAVKTVIKQEMNDEEIKNIHVEIMNLRKLDHPNILKLFEIFQDDQKFYVVTEKIEGCDLFDQIVEKKNFSEKEASEAI